LAVTSAEPSALIPGLPTVAASGLPGYEAVVMTGMFAAANTPTAIINRVNQESVRALNQADVKDRFFNIGVEVVASSPEQFAAKVKSELSSMGKVIKSAGIRAD
jgi:tripartite-type tricarboxylate transporter receptor subunit TctC